MVVVRWTNEYLGNHPSSQIVVFVGFWGNGLKKKKKTSSEQQILLVGVRGQRRKPIKTTET